MISARPLPRCARPTATAILVLVFCALQPPKAHAADLGWQTRTFPGVISVQSIIQTKDHHLWFAGTDGAQRFDGESWKRVPGLPPVPARRLLATDQGVWVATGGGFLQRSSDLGKPFDVGFRTEEGGLYLVDGARVERVDLHDVPSSWVWALVQRPGENMANVFAGTEAGVVEVSVDQQGRPAKAKMSVRATQLPSPLVTSLLFSDQATLWIGTSKGLVRATFDLHGNATLDPVLHEAIFSIANSPSGIVAATANGVWNVAGATPQLLRSDLSANAFWSAADVGLLVARDGAVENLAPASNDVFASIAVRDPLSIVRDHENGFWVGQRSGPVTQAFRPQVGNIGPPEGLLGDFAFSVHRARDHSMWISTTQGVVRMAGKTISSFRYGIDLPAWSARSIAETHEGIILIAADSGLLKYDGQSFRKLTKDDGLKDDTVRSVHVDGQNNIWIGWENAGLSVYPGGDIAAGPRQDLDVAKSLCAGAVTFVGETSAATSWWSTPTGLNRVQNNAGKMTVRCFGKAHNDGLNEVTAVVQSPRGQVWAATMGRVVMARWHGEASDGSFVNLPVDCGVSAGGFFSLTTTGSQLWATSNHGIFRADWAQIERCMEGHARTVDWLSINEQSGMRSPICTAAFPPMVAVDKDGDLWAATTQGLAIVKAGQTRQAPQVLIEGFSVNGSPLEKATRNAQEFVVPAKPQSLQWSYTAPAFVIPEAVRFRHQLVGVDANWIEGGRARSARYGLIPPGKYTFRVQATLAGLPPSDLGNVAISAIFVQPTLAQSWWFRVLLGVFIVAAAATVHHLRIRQINARHKDVHDERARLAREVHDGLGQAFLGVRFHLDGLDHLLGKTGATEQAGKLLDQSRQILTRAESELRQTIWNLRATTVSRPSLQTVLDQQCQQLTRELSCEVRLTWQGPSVSSGLVEHELPRIVQEAVANAVRHGKACRVDVAATSSESTLLVRIMNEGTPPSTPQNGAPRPAFGVIGMQERAVRMGGSLTTQAHAGGAFEVVINIPIPEPPAIQ